MIEQLRRLLPGGVKGEPRACWRCDPHAARRTLAPTAETHTDSDGVLVRVFACSDCGWTEGHADPVR